MKKIHFVITCSDERFCKVWSLTRMVLIICVYVLTKFIIIRAWVEKDNEEIIHIRWILIFMAYFNYTECNMNTYSDYVHQYKKKVPINKSRNVSYSIWNKSTILCFLRKNYIQKNDWDIFMKLGTLICIPVMFLNK